MSAIKTSNGYFQHTYTVFLDANGVELTVWPVEIESDNPVFEDDNYSIVKHTCDDLRTGLNMLLGNLLEETIQSFEKEIYPNESSSEHNWDLFLRIQRQRLKVKLPSILRTIQISKNRHHLVKQYGTEVKLTAKSYHKYDFTSEINRNTNATADSEERDKKTINFGKNHWKKRFASFELKLRNALAEDEIPFAILSGRESPLSTVEQRRRNEGTRVSGREWLLVKLAS